MAGKIIDNIYSKLGEVFDPETIGTLLANGIINIFVIVAVFLIFYLLWKVLNWLLQPIFRRSKMDETTTIFANSLIKYGILILGLITALDSVGIKTSAVLASLGIVGLTIGFAARDSLSNLISGIIIFLDRPFVIGDLVEIDGKYGQVERITLRSTRVVTVDGKMLAVPNVDVVNKTVTSYTNFPHLRLDIQVTIGVSEDIEKARKILMDLVSDPSYMGEPRPSVVVRELNDYNVLLELRVWIENEREHLQERFRLREAIFNAFNRHNIEMPYETIQLAPFRMEQKMLGN
ncbi:mechanosensitive ion channel family protein [Balneolaceae bacterium YR4-1]|uniref:Mechanosensitive ion channel family protein n=1 Tax=Halalkalibaculum roseum TaxID=2709311 RepID=A0A6M1T5E4_9BACT|nr:mechanosensitive ion channel family protein [Halalkalibaculum roseum]NGP77987.1 mechanosensitive ion channel family protein [Halalkalibaculum roseum]